MRERYIVPLAEEHVPFLMAAALAGVNIDPMYGGNRYIGYGHSKYGFGPVCLIDAKETPYVVEPHVEWFPWCSRREIFAAFKWAMDYWAKDRVVMLAVLKKDNSLHEQCVKRGLLRKIGFLEALPQEVGSEIHFYQYRIKL